MFTSFGDNFACIFKKPIEIFKNSLLKKIVVINTEDSKNQVIILN